MPSRLRLGQWTRRGPGPRTAAVDGGGLHDVPARCDTQSGNNRAVVAEKPHTCYLLRCLTYLGSIWGLGSPRRKRTEAVGPSMPLKLMVTLVEIFRELGGRTERCPFPVWFSECPTAYLRDLCLQPPYVQVGALPACPIHVYEVDGMRPSLVLARPPARTKHRPRPRDV